MKNKTASIRYTQEVIQKPCVDGNFEFEISEDVIYDDDYMPTKEIKFNWSVVSEQSIFECENTEDNIELLAERLKQDFIDFVKERLNKDIAEKDIKIDEYLKTDGHSEFLADAIEFAKSKSKTKPNEFVVLDGDKILIAHKGNQVPDQGYVWIPDFTKDLVTGQEYTDFMDNYNKQHRCCPNCGNEQHSTTLVGYFLYKDKKNDYKDENGCVCTSCGNQHTKHQRISRSQWRCNEFCLKYPEVIVNYSYSTNYKKWIKENGYKPNISYEKVSDLIKYYDKYLHHSDGKYKNLKEDWRKYYKDSNIRD